MDIIRNWHSLRSEVRAKREFTPFLMGAIGKKRRARCFPSSTLRSAQMTFDHRTCDGKIYWSFCRLRVYDIAAITRGSEPILWASGGDRGEIAVAAHRVIDTLGAGDVFHGAFTAATYEKQMTPALFRSALAYA